MSRVGIIYDPIYTLHDTGRHPENANCLLVTMEQLQRYHLVGENASSDYLSIPAHSATLDQIKCVHSEALVAKMQQMAHQAQKSKQPVQTRCRYNNFGRFL